MPSRLDIYRSANVLIRRHGEEAGAEAATRAQSFDAKGDQEGAAVWRQIAAAVTELQRRERPEGVAQH